MRPKHRRELLERVDDAYKRGARACAHSTTCLLLLRRRARAFKMPLKCERHTRAPLFCDALLKMRRVGGGGCRPVTWKFAENVRCRRKRALGVPHCSPAVGGGGRGKRRCKRANEPTSDFRHAEQATVTPSKQPPSRARLRLVRRWPRLKIARFFLASASRLRVSKNSRLFLNVA